jgi:diamine N-acetyltransferase
MGNNKLNVIIELKPVTAENFHECISLETKDNQKEFCASNLYSIAESKVEPLAIPICIYANETMAGFILYGPEYSDNGTYMSIDRFMIDRRFQGRGYGKLALEKLIENIKNNYAYKEIYLSYVPENIIAEKLFMGFGFVKTGEFSGNECIAVLKLS